MYSHDDFIEYTAKDRLEHALHGYDWYDFSGMEELSKKDMQFLIYPDDTVVIDVGLRGIYLSNYFYYDGKKHSDIAEKIMLGKKRSRSLIGPLSELQILTICMKMVLMITSSLLNLDTEGQQTTRIMKFEKAE